MRDFSLSAGPYGAVLFDLDGVLIESEGLFAPIWQRTLAEFGLNLDLEEVNRHFTGQQFDPVLHYLEAQHAFTPAPDFLTVLSGRFNEAVTQVTPIEGAADSLRALRSAGVPYAVCSNSEKSRLALKLEYAGLTELVGEHAYEPSRVGGRGKPAPDLYRFGAAQLGVDIRRCLVVEDSVTGAQAGLSAGATVWGLLASGHVHPDGAGALLGAGAARVLGSHPELMRELSAQLQPS